METKVKARMALAKELIKGIQRYTHELKNGKRTTLKELAENDGNMVGMMTESVKNLAYLVSDEAKAEKTERILQEGVVQMKTPEKPKSRIIVPNNG